METNPRIYYIAAILWIVVFFLGLLLLVTFLYGENDLKEVVRCSNYQTQFEAQVAFNSDPIFYAELDGGKHDGIACSNLPKS